MPAIDNQKSRIREYTLAIIISCVGASLMTFLSCPSCISDFNKFLTVASLSALMWAVMWIGNSELTHQIDKWISWVKFPVKRLFVGLISTIVFTVSVSIGLLKIWEYGKGIRFGSYYEFVGISLIITFLISLFLHGRAFLLEWKKSAVEAERYQKESVVAHYENLKSQVNPHFLFNSLNVLSNLVYTDQDKAALFIKKMSEVYRYVLDMQGRELVHLSEELAFTESYIFLQKIRFGENLQINNQLTIKSGKVVPLAIQMLIENAIKHNEISSDKPLNISLQYTKPYIKVENEIHLRSNPLKDSSGIGLENIKKRYEFLSSNKVEVLNQGNQFIVRIPLIPEEE